MEWTKTKSGFIARAPGHRWTIKKDHIRGWSLFRRITSPREVAVNRILSTPWLHVAMATAERESL